MAVVDQGGSSEKNLRLIDIEFRRRGEELGMNDQRIKFSDRLFL